MPATRTTPLEPWSELLREAGLRVTNGRIAALTYLDAHPHSSVAEIHSALEHEHPSLSTQSLHNITHDLTLHGILRRVDTPDSGSALFETRTADNHHHVQCIVCHRIEDIDCVVGAAPCLTPHGGHGMRLVEANVTFRGVCAECDPAVDSPQVSPSLPQRKDLHV